VTQRHRALLPWLALGVIYVVWGSTYLAIRIVVRELPPFAAASGRFLAAGLVMAAIAAIVDRDHPRPTRRQILDYAVIGVLLLGIGNGLVMWSEQRIPSGIAALLVGTVPLWITLLDGLRPGRQRWTPRVWFGSLVGFVGVALVARPEGGVAPGHWPGIIALQVATFSWSLGALYSQNVPRRLPVITASAVEMLAGSLALFAESRISGENLRQFQAASHTTWLALLYLAVFGSLVGFTAFAYCLNELPASIVGTYAYVNPVVAVALGAAFLGEPLSAGLMMGAALILGSVLLSTTGRRNGAPPKPKIEAVEDRYPPASQKRTA
jgi:drug/metabolite transporter (DMT)-like permease